jgi:hypothetical protein
MRDYDTFFNRDSDVEKVLRKLRKGQSVSIFGKERIGKTWLLLRVSDPQVAARHGLMLEKHLFCYIDCKKWADLDEAGCFHWTKATLEKLVLTRGTLAVSPPVGEIYSDAYHWLDQLLFLFEHEGFQLTVQLDHFDCLAKHGRLTLTLLGSLRALEQKYDCMTYLTTSRCSLVDLQSRLPRIKESPFFDIFWDHELGPFTREEAHKFVRSRLGTMGVSFSEDVLEHICRLSKREPYQLQMACLCAFDVWHEQECPLCREHCDKIEEQFSQKIQSAAGDTL